MKKTKKIVICSFIAMLLTLNCKIITKAAKVPSTKKIMAVVKGGEDTIKIKGANIQAIKFKSLNPKIAAVNKSGKVKAKNIGSCEIKIIVSYRKHRKDSKTLKKELKKEIRVVRPDEVKSLKKIIKYQNKTDSRLPEDISNSVYTWDKMTGRLVGIEWQRVHLKGKVSFSKFPALKKLYFFESSVTSVDLSKNVELRELNCRFSQLKKLDLSKNGKLRILYCQNNKISNLTLCKNSKLEIVNCNYNKIKTLDLSNAKNLKVLYCMGNQLTKLDLTNDKKLFELNCKWNKLKILDLSTIPEFFRCYADMDVEIIKPDKDAEV